jgi:hypothetical protein
MKRTIICLLICIATSITLPAVMASEEGMITQNHQITISTDEDLVSVNEVLTIKGESNETYSTLSVWVQSLAKDVNIYVNSKLPDSIEQNGSEYICNISSFGIKKEDFTQVTILYNLDKDEEFIKTVVRSTDIISVTFNQKKIFSETNLAPGTSFNLKLYETTETSLYLYITVFIIMIIILIIVFAMYTLRKQKSAKVKDIASGSEELLNTKKTLLMSLLKEIEKQHRANQISDDTYHKLKERYKQEAIEAMKQLEDMKSKI